MYTSKQRYYAYRYLLDSFKEELMKKSHVFRSSSELIRDFISKIPQPYKTFFNKDALFLVEQIDQFL